MSVDPALIDDDATSASGEDGNPMVMVDGQINKHQSATPGSGSGSGSGSGHSKKRSRKATGDAIVDAMLEIAAASKMRAAAIMKSEDRFTISRCIKVLDEMQGVDQHLYFFALDLFESPSARETFISLKCERRVTWLLGKYIKTEAEMDDFDLELDEMEMVAAAAGYYYYNSIVKQAPPRPPPPGPNSGSTFMNEVINGPDDFFREMLRMDKHVFHKLSDILRQRGLLRDTPGVGIEEQLAIFLNIVGHNQRNRVIQERFQHSGETISRHFNHVLKAIKSLSREFLQAPLLSTPPQIFESNRFYPYFKDCIGVMDGMHVLAHVPTKDHTRFRNREGQLSQNVLAACTFDLQFIFVYPGWEGSAADSRILRAVLDDPEQNFPLIPQGKYYLVDGDYWNMEGFIAPFSDVRHCIHEFTGANQLPRNPEELFNHRHCFLREAIQTCFKVLKERFPILKVAPQYAFEIQRDIVIAACVIHNFIRKEERNDWLFAAAVNVEAGGEGMVEEEFRYFDDPPILEQSAVSLLRQSIASAMWADFTNRWDQW